MYERCCGIFGQDLVKYTKNFKTNLYNSIENRIKKGLNTFLIGVNGGFNKIALNACRNFCSIYPNIKIKLVITNANPFLSIQEYKNIYKIYKNEEIVLFTTENIENEKMFLSDQQIY